MMRLNVTSGCTLFTYTRHRLTDRKKIKAVSLFDLLRRQLLCPAMWRDRLLCLEPLSNFWVCVYLADGVEGAEDGVVEVAVGQQQVDVLHHAVLEHRPDLVRVGIAHLKEKEEG